MEANSALDVSLWDNVSLVHLWPTHMVQIVFASQASIFVFGLHVVITRASAIIQGESAIRHES